MLQLDAEIVRINARAQLNFFDGRSVLMLARFFFFLGKFVAVFADFDQATNRRHSVGRNLDKIHAMLARERERIVQRKYPELLVLVADDADFAGADFPVDAHLRGGG